MILHMESYESSMDHGWIKDGFLSVVNQGNHKMHKMTSKVENIFGKLFQEKNTICGLYNFSWSEHKKHYKQWKKSSQALICKISTNIWFEEALDRKGWFSSNIFGSALLNWTKYEVKNNGRGQL